MGTPSFSTPAVQSVPADSDARLRGRWLFIARGAWILLVGLTLAIFFASLPIYLAQLQTPCNGDNCEYQQLTVSQAEALKRIGLSPDTYATYTLSFAFVCIAACLLVSAVLIWRKAHDRLAFIVALLLVALGPVIEVSNVPVGFSLLLIANEFLSSLASTLLIIVFLLFPNGRFVPRWTRWVLGVFLLANPPLTFLPIGIFSPSAQPAWLVTIGGLATGALVQVYRYRQVSGPLERQQTKWVVFGIAVPVTVFVGQTVLSLLFPTLTSSGSLFFLVFNETGFLLPFFFPLALGVALLRYRLWDIDSIINKALVYGSLTALLGALYAGFIIGLTNLAGAITGTAEQPVALVISTLAIAALFLPVRWRIQALIDRRFYRRKYDAEKALAAFSATLRNEVNLEQVCEQLLTVVNDTMQPISVSLWLRSPDRRKDSFS